MPISLTPQDKQPLIQRFRKGRGVGIISTWAQGTDTLLVLSETDRVQCLVDHSSDVDWTLKWTLLVPPNKKVTCVSEFLSLPQMYGSECYIL